jgi:hypothetical protein
MKSVGEEENERKRPPRLLQLTTIWERPQGKYATKSSDFQRSEELK